MAIGHSNNFFFIIDDVDVTSQYFVVDNHSKLSTASTVLQNFRKRPLEERTQKEIAYTYWRKPIKIPMEYEECQEALFEMHKPLHTIWAGYFATINTTTYHIELTSPYIQPIH